jgi:hypothetical protein
LTSPLPFAIEHSFDSLSLFESPLDIEIMWTSNENSVLDTNRARREFIVQVSPLHIVLSESRITRLSLIVPPSGFQSKQPRRPSIGDEALPPRLELLAIFLLHSIDFSVGRVRMSFVADEMSQLQSNIFAKEVDMEESMADFLSVVLSFDLSYPHEEALSSAMQICIDRLTGIGLPLEESWEATNTALLNFLEDIAEIRQLNPGGQGVSSEGMGVLDGSFADGHGSMPADLVQYTLQRSVERTVALFSPQLAEGSSDLDLLNAGVVIDLPDGLSLSFVKLFYDFHLNGSVPAFFVTNAAGVHLVRLIAPDTSISGDDENGFDALSDNADVDASRNPSLEKSGASSLQSGVGFGIFELDKSCGFGKGGLPLSVLGTDVSADDDDEHRERERVIDVEIGEVEILFTQQLAADAVARVTRVFASIPNFGKPDVEPLDDVRTHQTMDSSLLVAGVSISILLASDELFPFCRLTLADAVMRTKVASSPSTYQLSPQPDVRVSSQSLSLLNLTPEGERYPRVTTVLPSARTVPFRVRYYRSATGSEIQIELQGFRIVLLRQFINECLQFFTSGDYGLGLLLKNLRKTDSNDSSGGPTLRYRISLFDSSVILPRCSSSSDMIALELNEAHIFSSNPVESFVMPTESTPLEVFERYQTFGQESTKEFDFQDCVESLNDTTDHNGSESEKSAVRRTIVQLKGFRLFTSLSESGTSRVDGIESPSFRLFYSIDGRASAGRPVYRRHVAANNLLSEEEEGEEESMLNAEKALRCWREISTDLLSLEIFVDYAPHFRLLIRDPPDYFPKEIGLDVSISQFCLLLSVWYRNMKEEPAMFPYRAPADMDSRQPSKEFNFPEYGTDALRDWLKDASGVLSESAFVFSRLSFRCFFDAIGRPRDEVPGMQLAFTDAVVHVTSDDVGAMRIAAGSSGASFVDESRTVDRVISTGKGISAGAGEAIRYASWADLKFGLESNLRTLSEAKLPQAFQLSVFMIPGWSFYQLGFDNAHVALSDFGPIMKFLEFVSTYFNDPAYGNPSFEASNQAPIMKNETKEDTEVAEETNVDFRLWLTRPRLSVPCDSLGDMTPGLRLVTESGFWYRYTTIGDYATQECASRDLGLLYDDKFVSTEQSSSDDPIGRPMIEGLSFGLRIDFNNAHNHTDICLQIPYTDSNACSITSPRVCVLPTILPPPTICSPLNEPHRFLGPQVCEITAIIEVLPATSTALLRLFAGPEEEGEQPGQEVPAGETNDLDGFDDASTSEESGDPEPTKSFVANVGDLRLFALDPVLGPHLPVAVLSIASVSITASRFAEVKSEVEILRGESAPEDFQAVIKGHFWADYFKLGLTRSWEPLLEPYQFLALYEQSRFRGTGITLNSDSPLHLNVSGALLLILDEVIDSFDRLVRDTFQVQPDSASVDRRGSIARSGRAGSQVLLQDSLEEIPVLHQVQRLLESGDRVAFSLRNMTGHKIRFYRAKDALDEGASKPVVVAYVDHVQSTELSFKPSISLVKNMSIIDVPYPGLPNSCHHAQNQHSGNNPAVDVQLPGFRWLQGIMVDTFGRRFESLIPRSEELLLKTGQDWRLGNVMKLLVEVGLENGGRQVVVRSLFSVVNKTAHTMCLALHPDPTHLPGMGTNDISMPISLTGDSDALIEPDQLYQVPTLLLESALHKPGSHLGSVWAKPLASSSNSHVLHSFADEDTGDSSDLKVAYCSRPIQLAKIVNESALLFEAGRGKDMAPEDATSGVQVSCPITREEGERPAPFCYAVEVGRSPLVKARLSEEQEKEKQGKLIHGPIAYTLSFHPPFVIVNLLPEKGRFELMHAVRRTVVWFADLEPGQHISIHSVGLDAPLLLLLNLGFCRTPVGEGALVHHGVDPPAGARGRLLEARACQFSYFLLCLSHTYVSSLLHRDSSRKPRWVDVDRQSWQSCHETAW